MTENLREICACTAVSVIVPIYNAEATLCRCVDSILAQTYRNLQILLINDASTDRSAELCERYAAADGRVRVISLPENGGVSAARNAGLDAATGEYLTFVDSDDWVEADFVEFLLSLLLEQNADIAACGARIVRKNGKIDDGETFDEVLVMDSKEAVRRMCYNDRFYITLWDKIYRRSLFDGLRFPDGLQFEDTALSAEIAGRARLLAAHGIGKYYYVYAPASITNCPFSPKKLDYLTAADRMAEYVTSCWEDLRPAANRKRLHAAFSTLTQSVCSSTDNAEIDRALIERIRPLKRGVFFDPNAPKRDKIAILSLSFGLPFFRFAWRLYRKGKKGL